MKNIPCDGRIARWDAWYQSTFEQARKDYYAKYGEAVKLKESLKEKDDDNDIHKFDLEISEQDLRIKTARAQALEIDNEERMNTLVPRKNVEDFVRFLMTIFSEKIRDLTREDNKDDLYNMICEEISKDIEVYINEHGIEHVITKETIDEGNAILENNPIIDNCEKWGI